MAQKQPYALRAIFSNVWALVCLAAVGSCGALAIQLLLRTPPLDRADADETPRMLLILPALFGALAGLYGIFASILIAARRRKIKALNDALRDMQNRTERSESLRLRQTARLDELSMLREVATIVNQESDFTIIAEKVLELIDGLLEPLRCTIFLQEGEKGRLQPLAQCRNRKVYSGTKVQAPDVSGFDLSAFERHSIVCRVQGRELQAIVPLKVEDKTLGVLWLAFPTDARPPEAQTAEFNRTRRTVLLEITQHISLAVKTKHLQTKAVVDGLTGLYSRSHFDAQLQATVELAQRTGEVFSLLLADIDHFKAINDTYGHATGDVVLSRVAMRIQRALRKYDTAYRYGGEEIAILLPRTRVGHAAATAERLRSLVESQRFRATDGRLVKVTMSIGVAQFKPADGPQSLLERADRRLYQAKYGGRNRVVPAAA